MLGAYAAAVLICAASLALGEALLRLCGWRRWSWLSASVGLAALTVICGVAVRVPGRATTAATAATALTIASVLYLWGRAVGLGDAARAGLPVAIVAGAVTSIPFAVSGGVGVLGVGLDNDDMAAHLLIADWLRDPGEGTPSFVEGGYPFGPHAVVAAVAQGPGVDLIQAFAGLTLALAILTGLTALHVLGDLSFAWRTVGATLVALPYLGAAYLAQGAFKEPLQALLIIGFALMLGELLRAAPAQDSDLAEETARGRGPGRARQAITRAAPFGVLLAASVFNYSLPGALWMASLAVVLLAAWYLRHRLPVARPALQLRMPAAIVAAAVVLVALLTLREWGRIAEFSQLDVLRDEAGNLGNLGRPLSPLEALGVWPTGEFRISPADAGVPEPVFYAGAALAMVLVAIGLVAAWRRGNLALPAALGVAAAIYVAAEAISTPYMSAKALAIAAPVVMLIALRGILPLRSPLARGLAAIFAVAAAGSTLLVLRGSPVAPDAHAAELGSFRPLVQGKRVLFLGRDGFVAFWLRGAEVSTHVVNHYNTDQVSARFGSNRAEEKYDFDALAGHVLRRFPYVITTTSAHASEPPRGFELVRSTPSYRLWKGRGRVPGRGTLPESSAPGAVLDCDTEKGRRLSRREGVAAVWPSPPVEGSESEWSPGPDATHTSAATQELELAPGKWDISLEYDSPRPLEVTAPGLDAALPANLDYRGPTPYFPVGRIEIERKENVAFRVTTAAPPLIGRLLGGSRQAHLRSLAATPAGPVKHVPLSEACGRYVDWYRLKR